MPYCSTGEKEHLWQEQKKANVPHLIRLMMDDYLRQ